MNYEAQQLLGIKSTKPMGIVILSGFPYKALTAFGKVSGVTLKEIAEVLDFDPRTLRRRKVAGCLTKDESNTLFRAARVMETVLGMTHGDEEKARRWIRRENPGLDGKRPLDLLKTDADTQDVIDLVGRIREGVET